MTGPRGLPSEHDDIASGCAMAIALVLVVIATAIVVLSGLLVLRYLWRLG